MATPAVDRTYGQRSVFGVLSGPTATATAPADDDDLDCEDEHDALAYLMLVRSEASKIPTVLVAPRPGPQAFPPGYAARKDDTMPDKADEARRKRNKRRQRHWDDQDDQDGEAVGDGDGVKRRRTAQVSYEDLYDDVYEEKEEKEDEKKEEEKKEEKTTEKEEKDEKKEDLKASVYHQQALYETVDDTRGYYDDGAYVAAEDNANAPSDGDGDAAWSTAYRVRLLAHFAAMRAHLAALSDSPTSTSTAAASEVGPLSVRSGVFKHWLHVLRTTDPLPAQVAAMDKVSVLRLLRILQRGLEAGASASSRSSRSGRFVRSLAGGGSGGGGGGGNPAQLDVSPRTIRWLWALLARLPGRGELDYREVGYIRDVAKQAVMRLAHLSYDVGGMEGEEGIEGREEDEGAEYEAGEVDDEEGKADDAVGGDEEGEEPAVGDAHELDAEDIAMDIDSEPEEDHVPDQATTTEAAVAAVATDNAADDADADDDADTETQQRAALEMVLAVAGEFYGQRDLLAFRSRWAAAS